VELQDQLPQIQALNGGVVGVSVDGLSESKSLIEQLNLGFPLVEDQGHRLGSAFGVFRLPGGMDMGPVDSHSIFVIDSSGHVRWRQLAPDSMHVPVDDVIAALKQA
jgi:thioredoxin-dependent peroxiredoxin